MLKIKIFVFVFISFVFAQSVTTTKRILLNDPDLINAKLLNLEKSINEIKTENSDLKQQNQNLGQRIQQMETENNNLGQKIQTLETENCNSEQKIQTIETENSRLGQRIKIIETDNKRLKQLINTDMDSHGATFIRWGRKNCPSLNGTTLVYSGIAGGGDSDEKGSGANRLCLPHDPDTLSTSPSLTLESATYLARVYGTEYQFSYKNVAIEDDAPCAVCRVMTATSSLMIPAKSSCPSGWSIQYDGMLVGNYYGYSASEYVCLDGDPQIFEGRRASTNGNLFYPAVSVCGTLPCPYYGNLKYLPCVLCTK